MSKAFTLIVSAGPIAIITNLSLPSGTVGASYSQTLAASGGAALPYTWSLISGALPAGLTLSAGGSISGVSTSYGTSTFSVVVTDAGGFTASGTFALTINHAPLVISTASTLPTGVAGTPYSQTLAATGGVPPYTWSITSGALPVLLALSPTGVIGGVPAAAGMSTFGVNVQDSSLHVVTQWFLLSISLGPFAVVTPTVLPSGVVGASYSQTLAAVGGFPPYTWLVTSGGAWPAGLAISSAGLISGIPTTAGTFWFGVAATDGSSAIANQWFTLPINTVPFTVTTHASLPSGVAGTHYSQTLSATGGVSPYTWSVLSGPLPPGLALSTAGVISGTPTTSGSYSFTAQVQESGPSAASQSFSLTVAASGNLSRAGVISQLAVGGGWDTTIWLINRSAVSIQTELVFHGDDGGRLNLSLTVRQPGVLQQVTAAVLDSVIAPNTTLAVAIAGPASVVQGWADVLSSGPLNGFAVFRDGGAAEAAVPLQSQIGSSISLPFDNTGGYSAGVAIVNLSSSPANLTATVWDENGNQLASQPVALTKTDTAGNGHDAFMLPARLPVTAGKRGIVQFQGNRGTTFTSAGALTGLALKADPNGLFTSTPIIVP